MTELQTLSPDARAARTASMTPRRRQALSVLLLAARPAVRAHRELRL